MLRGLPGCGTGRTSRMLAMVKPGDQIVVATGPTGPLRRG